MFNRHGSKAGLLVKSLVQVLVTQLNFNRHGLVQVLVTQFIIILFKKKKIKIVIRTENLHLVFSYWTGPHVSGMNVCELEIQYWSASSFLFLYFF
jgi:hypothetical protein